MLNDKIATILEKLRELEQQLEYARDEKQSALSYQLKRRRVTFTAAVRALHG